jgi:hypothetical protein
MDLRVLTIFILFFILFNVQCSSVTTNSGDENDTDGENSEWSIPEDKVFIGQGRDGIASIDDPKFGSTGDIDFINDDDLITAIQIGDDIRGYPNVILNYHEIVNDHVNDVPVAVTYCPLTGSGLAWNRVINGVETTFGVSGFIYKNNLIAYDRETESFWSQMLNRAVAGSEEGKNRENYRLIEMTWKAWKEAYPNGKVLSGITGFDLNYTLFPYGDYRSNNNNILFPIEREDDRLERKARTHGIFYSQNLVVFPISAFSDEGTVINSTYSGEDVVVAGMAKDDLVVSYSRTLNDGTTLDFLQTDEPLPAIMQDEEGTVWSLFGEALSGPRQGEWLQQIPSYNSYWFGWVDFYGTSPRTPVIQIP